MLPTINSYYPYSSENYGVNSLRMFIGNLVVFFSYQTPIAFNHPSTGLVIRKNDWSSTTGKHLNAINPDKSVRIDGEEFEAKLEEIVTKLGL